MCENEEENKMGLITNDKKTAAKNSLLSQHPNFNKKVPRLTTVNEKAQIDPENDLQRKWFEEFKK